jgi:hypothetical protein
MSAPEEWAIVIGARMAMKNVDVRAVHAHARREDLGTGSGPAITVNAGERQR